MFGSGYEFTGNKKTGLKVKLEMSAKHDLSMINLLLLNDFVDTNVKGFFS